MLTIGINDDSGAGMAGDAPKPVSLGLDGPTAQEARVITIKIARRLGRRMRIPIDERWLMMHGGDSKKPARHVPPTAQIVA
jgi:hypothetical protein